MWGWRRNFLFQVLQTVGYSCHYKLHLQKVGLDGALTPTHKMSWPQHKDKPILPYWAKFFQSTSLFIPDTVHNIVIYSSEVLELLIGPSLGIHKALAGCYTPPSSFAGLPFHCLFLALFMFWTARFMFWCKCRTKSLLALQIPSWIQAQPSQLSRN
jgi:hypothetical protein